MYYFDLLIISRFLCWQLYILLFVCCNFNPLGDRHSHIDDNNRPFLKIPSAFLLSQVSLLNIPQTQNTWSYQLNLSWSVSYGADDYTVVYGTSSGNYTNTVTGCINKNLFTCVVSSIPKGYNYYFNVISRNNFGTTNSNEVSVSLPKLKYAYVVLRGNSTVELCGVDFVNGSLSNCVVTGSGFTSPEGGAFIYNGYAYFSNATGVNPVTKCSVDGLSGLLSACVTMSLNTVSNPGDISIYNGFAYISNFGTNSAGLLHESNSALK